ncbi:MAG: ribonuclease M5 [Firmicutes bacterium]|nr:ribonuclease M5 [Bacillota bacterium]
MEKIRIKEAIVVEGRDDIAVVERAVDTLILATHGFGITKETWALIERAYNNQGIIILTDPDFSGEEIRRKLTARFPEAKQAYLPRSEATRGDDIGIENATPEAVLEALAKVKTVVTEPAVNVTKEDLVRLGLSGCDGAAERREAVAAELGIAMGNAKAMLRMLKGYGISLEEVEKAVEWVNRRNLK